MQPAYAKRAYVVFATSLMIVCGVCALLQRQGVSGFVGKSTAIRLAFPGISEAALATHLREESIASYAAAGMAILMTSVALVIFRVLALAPLHNGDKSGVPPGRSTRHFAQAAQLVVVTTGLAVAVERVLDGAGMSIFLVRVPATADLPARWVSQPRSAEYIEAEGDPAAKMDWGFAVASYTLDLAFAWLLRTAVAGSALFPDARAEKRLCLFSMALSTCAHVVSFSGSFTVVTSPVAGGILTGFGVLCGLLFCIGMPIVAYRTVQYELRAAERSRVACAASFDSSADWASRTARTRALFVVLYAVVGISIFQMSMGAAKAVTQNNSSLAVLRTILDGATLLFKGVLIPAAFFLVTISATANAEAHFQRLAAEDNEKKRIHAQKLIIRYVCHEVRVPLNSLTIGIDVVADALGLTPLVELEDSSPLAARELEDKRISSQDLEQCRETLQYMTQGTSGMRRILNDVLQLEALQQGRVTLIKESFDPQMLSDRTMDTFSPQARKAGVNLSAVVNHHGKPCCRLVVGDHDRLLQVCSNLISNALKFTPRGNDVRIEVNISEYMTLGEEHGRVGVRRMLLDFRVVDSGVGIDPADQAKLFQPFHQLESGAKFKENSTGLGLSICRGIVEMHGGEIGLDSRGVGTGSTFWFRVPLDCAGAPPPTTQSTSEETATKELVTLLPDDQAALSAEARDRSGSLYTRPEVESDASGRPRRLPALRRGPPLAGPRSLRTSQTTSGSSAASSVPAIHLPSTPVASPPVLPNQTCIIVDDIAGNRLLLQRLIQRMGCSVRCAANGRDGVDEALALLAKMSPKSPPLLVLMDGNMPVLDGVSATKELLCRAPVGRVVVVGVTGNAHEEDCKAFLDAGAVEVLPKPVSRTMLLDMWGRIAKRARSATLLPTIPSGTTPGAAQRPVASHYGDGPAFQRVER